MKTATVIGVGPDRGLGARLCKRFAADGLKVIVAGRTLSALQAVVDDITKAGGAAVPFVADATREGDIVALFDAAGDNLDARHLQRRQQHARQDHRDGGRLFRECLARGLLRRLPVRPRGGAADGAEEDRHAAVHRRQCLAARTLRLGAFNSSKAGLRTLAQAMAKEYASDGIHVGHVVVDGAIAGDKIFSRFPDAAGREDSLIDIDGIVDAFAFLYRQPERAWSFELDVRTSKEKW